MPGRALHPLPVLLLAPSATAQLEILQPPPSLPTLPDPPALEHLLLESPVPLAIAGIALALASYAIATRLDRRRLARLLPALLAPLFIALVLLSLAVKTARERVIESTRQLVAAVAQARTDELDRALDDDVRLFVRGSASGWTKSGILTWIDKFLAPGRSYEVGKHRVSSVEAEVGPSGQIARSRAHVVITPADDSPPTQFICMLTWRKNPAGEWTLTQVDPLWLQGWGVIAEGDMTLSPGW